MVTLFFVLLRAGPELPAGAAWEKHLKLIFLVASNDGVMSHKLARQVIRFAWHLMSILWIAGIGVIHVAVGLFDAVVTRGKHIGWPMLTAIGVLSSLALM